MGRVRHPIYSNKRRGKMWHSAGERHNHRQALCKVLLNDRSPCEECNTRVVLLMRIRHHKVKEVRMQPDQSPETHTFDNHIQRLVLPGFPLFGGMRSFTLASRFPFVCVRLRLQVYLVVLKALFTSQHWRTIGSLLVWSNSAVSSRYANYRSLRHVCGHTSTWRLEASKPWPISAVSVKFRQAAA